MQNYFERATQVEQSYFVSSRNHAIALHLIHNVIPIRAEVSVLFLDELANEFVWIFKGITLDGSRKIKVRVQSSYLGKSMYVPMPNWDADDLSFEVTLEWNKPFAKSFFFKECGLALDEHGFLEMGAPLTDEDIMRLHDVD